MCNKSKFKNAAGVDTSKFAKKVDLSSLKSEADKLDTDKLVKVPTGLSSLKSKVHKLDVDKLVPVPVDLSKLSDIVKNKVVKKTEYNELFNTDASNLVRKTDSDTKISEIEKKNY